MGEVIRRSFGDQINYDDDTDPVVGRLKLYAQSPHNWYAGLFERCREWNWSRDAVLRLFHISDEFDPETNAPGTAAHAHAEWMKSIRYDPRTYQILEEPSDTNPELQIVGTKKHDDVRDEDFVNSPAYARYMARLGREARLRLEREKVSGVEGRDFLAPGEAALRRLPVYLRNLIIKTFDGRRSLSDEAKLYGLSPEALEQWRRDLGWERVEPEPVGLSSLSDGGPVTGQTPGEDPETYKVLYQEIPPEIGELGSETNSTLRATLDEGNDGKTELPDNVIPFPETRSHRDME